MTEHYELVDKYKIVDAFEPGQTLLVVLNKDQGKKFVDMLNAYLELERQNAELREQRRELKQQLYQLRLWKEKKQDTLASMPKERKKRDPSTPRKKPTYKEKECEMCGNMFVPRSGRSTRCESCQLKINTERNRDPARRTPPTMRTEIRGTRSVPLSENQIRVPTIEEVLAMPVGPERSKWEARWSPAEKQQAQIEKGRIEREKMRKMRNRGFSLDDPIMGIGTPAH